MTEFKNPDRVETLADMISVPEGWRIAFGEPINVGGGKFAFRAVAMRGNSSFELGSFDKYGDPITIAHEVAYQLNEAIEKHNNLIANKSVFGKTFGDAV